MPSPWNSGHQGRAAPNLRERRRPRHGETPRNRGVPRKANLPSRSHRPSFPRPLPSRCGVPRFAAPAAYGFPRRRGFQHSDGRRVPRLTRSLSECWKPRQVCPPFPPSRRLFRAFNGRRVPSPTRRLLEGWESRPRVPVPATPPRLHAARRAAPKKPKKRAPSRMPFTRLSNPRNIRQPMPDIQRLRPQTRDSRSHLLRRP